MEDFFFLSRIRAEHSKEETDMKLEPRTVSYKLEKFAQKQSVTSTSCLRHDFVVLL